MHHLSYVGQTGRKLSMKISEHRNYTSSNKNSSNKNQSVITDPRLGFNHEFDWKNVQILDKKRFLNKYLNSEMLHIHMQNGLNLKTDRILVLFLCFLTRYVKTIMRFKIVIG